MIDGLIDFVGGSSLSIFTIPTWSSMAEMHAAFGSQ